MLALEEQISQIFIKNLGCHHVEEVQIVPRSAFNSCFAFTTDRGKFFVKTHHPKNGAMYEAEAKGLQYIDNTASVRVPTPYYYGETESVSLLILEHIDLVPHTPKSQRILGTQLAKMHLTRWEYPFGFDFNNTLGTTPQINTWTRNWVEFFSQYRLLHLLRLLEKQYGDQEIVEQGEAVVDALPKWTCFSSITIRPSLIHGDLWSGNTAATSDEEPIVFDPAPYLGHHETELGMTSLFGGFLPEFYEAYHALIPKEKGFEERQKIYQLYHLLNHYSLFGESYRAEAMQLMKELL